MPFWSNETLQHRLTSEKIITPFDAKCVKYCAYEMNLGQEVFLTSSDDGKKEVIETDGQIVIPPGQFALLITKEIVKIPPKVIAFISIKAGIKFRGLVNISGFHVDPGFEGRLKFSVYNTGGQSINLSRDMPVFLIFFADLDKPAKPVYCGDHQGQMNITSTDVMNLQGNVVSQVVLNERITKLEHLIDIWTRVLLTLAAGILLFVITIVAKSCSSKEESSLQGLIQISTPQITTLLQEKKLTNTQRVTFETNSSSQLISNSETSSPPQFSTKSATNSPLPQTTNTNTNLPLQTNLTNTP